ncbi:replicative DNA helicase [Buchnera aphidicola]|uniref:Replicative DNA helicase n=1 Tax=Buchnera aphidicola (Sarucallis kahawaluokalani) TaxID=1241878 RepID=A0A4D6YIF2_9GAMM|nr:replicative DNA helicase [Buchnera aphidicola]QCI26151.1 replicative DNA helicase [Buchnera aphidicola (Sarucallis kahawaluokalani)]
MKKKILIKNHNIKKNPPYSLEAEQCILGGLMLDNTKWDMISQHISEEDFFNIPHKIIFHAMQKLINNNCPIDLITLSTSLKKQNRLDTIGKFSYLSEIIKNTPSISNITAYAKIVKEYAILREIITIGTNITNLGYNTNGKTSTEILDYAECNVLNISQKIINKNQYPKDIKFVLDKTITTIEKIINSPNENNLTGLDTGYIDLNKITLGLQNSELVIIAARPSMGKTTLAMNICEHVAITYHKPVLIFSLEMPSEQIMLRMLSSLSRVYQHHLRTGKLTDEDWSCISSTINILLNKNNIYIDDSSQLTPNEIHSKAKKLYKSKGLNLIMIDYLQLIHVPHLSTQRTLEISEISRTLKSLAKELNIPIIAVSQLNRSLEQRSDRRPINSDLRESGALEQDADLIMFIYRDELYNEHTTSKGIAEIIIGKQRNGPIGMVKLIFNGNLCRFDNYFI